MIKHIKNGFPETGDPFFFWRYNFGNKGPGVPDNCCKQRVAISDFARVDVNDSDESGSKRRPEELHYISTIALITPLAGFNQPANSSLTWLNCTRCVI